MILSRRGSERPEYGLISRRHHSPDTSSDSLQQYPFNPIIIIMTFSCFSLYQLVCGFLDFRLLTKNYGTDSHLIKWDFLKKIVEKLAKTFCREKKNPKHIRIRDIALTRTVGKNILQNRENIVVNSVKKHKINQRIKGPKSIKISSTSRLFSFVHK